MKKIVMGLITFALFVAGSANAAYFSISGGGSDTKALPFTGYVGDHVVALINADNFGQINLDQDVQLEFEFLGSSAANTNFALNAGGAFFQTGSTAVGSKYYVNGLAGLLDFSFKTVLPDTTEKTLANGSAVSGTLGLAVFVESATSLILLFEDQTDGDFNDMVVRVSAVPLPAAFWLFGSGLVGLFGMRKRAAKKA